jgi:hypothetical protein
MLHFGNSQTRDGVAGMSEADFNHFYESYSCRSYLGDPWKLLTLVLLDLHFFATVALYRLNWPSEEFRSLLHSSTVQNQWVFSPSKWAAGGGDDRFIYERTLSEMATLTTWTHALRYTCATMLLIQTLLFLQFAVHLDAKLAILTESMAFVASELMHFLFVFGFVIVMYALAGQFLYGADLAEFNSLASSAQSCFALMLGGGDFARMQTVNETGTMVYYWSWISLGLLIIMNLIIAILSAGHERATSVIYGDGKEVFTREPVPAKVLHWLTGYESPRKEKAVSQLSNNNAVARRKDMEKAISRRKDMEEELAEIKYLLHKLVSEKN